MKEHILEEKLINASDDEDSEDSAVNDEVTDEKKKRPMKKSRGKVISSN